MFIKHLIIVSSLMLIQAYAAVAGLPFSEDFNSTALKDTTKTTAEWSTAEQSLILQWKKSQGAVASLAATTAGSDITADTGDTLSVALGDVDNDGDLDLVASDWGTTNRLYLNNGTADPFNGVAGSDITADAHNTRSVTLGDVDNDGDLDLIAGNDGAANRLYLNNGTADPFAGVAGSDITADTGGTLSVTLGDVDNDGDLDLVAGDNGAANRLYLNNGTADPFAGVAGSDITADAGSTTSVTLGDVDGDGDLDLVAGSYNQVNRLYLNNGTADPFAGVAGSDITADTGNTNSVALGDVDGDGDLDLVEGNSLEANRLYLNNGTADPFNGVTGSDITADAGSTTSVTLGDVDGDGDLDLIAGNNGAANRLYPNNGTADPFAGVAGSDITADGHGTRSVTLGDVDGDGDLDLVAGNAIQTNRLYLNKGIVTPFSNITGTDITADANATYSVTLGDVDNDGDLDLVAGNRNQANRLYLNNGDGTFAAGTDITADAHFTYSVILGDVDGDGDLDLVAGNMIQANRLYLNDGNGNFAAGTDITADAQSTRSVILGDVDGDGDLDVVAGNDSEANRLYLNNGSGTFAAGTDITADAHFTYSVILGDVDGDGDLDVVAGNYGQTNRLYLNNGNGTFAAGTYITADAEFTRSVILGDVDNDGDLDLVAGNGNQTNKVYLNDASGNFAAGTDITTDAHATYSVTLGDVDGDGDLDLVAGNRDEANRLYLNNGSGTFAAGTDITADVHATFSVTLGDVDGDGDLDLVVGNNAQANRLYLNNSMATPFSNVTGRDITTDTGADSIIFGDVDSDGDLDLVAGNFGSVNRLYLGDGSGNFAAGTAIGTDADYTGSLVLGDIDGDGDLDLIAGNASAPNRLYLGDGSGNFAAGTAIGTDSVWTNTVILCDIDRDGDLDLIAANEGENLLYLNDGSGNFAVGTAITADAHNTHDVTVGDIDHDGDLDLVVGNRFLSDRIYLNNGTADPFNGVTGSIIGMDVTTRSVILSDVNGDGNLDLVAGRQGDTNQLFLGNGDGTFAGGTNITADALNTLDLALADVDNDGDLDLVEGNYGTTNRLYLSNGDGTFAAGSDITADTHNTKSVTPVDLDGNGELELVIANGSDQTNRLYERRHYRTHQNIGASLRIDTATSNINFAKLSVSQTLPKNTWVDYYLSNNGGAKYFRVKPDTAFTFPTTGTDLRWKAKLNSLSPALSPSIDELNITSNSKADITSNGGGATAAINARENQTAVTTVTATDPDGDTVTFSLSGGADQAKFDINASTGVLTFKTAPDYEAPSDADTNRIYLVTVTATEAGGNLTDTQDISVTVTDDTSDNDSDGDGILDVNDNCKSAANADQSDFDKDGIGDVCDSFNSLDVDGDGRLNTIDNCPNIANYTQLDADNDGIGDACDSVNDDTDGDGVANTLDNCSTTANSDQADLDGDGLGDACDSFNNLLDPDNDGLLNDADNCPDTSNASQSDTDGDGIGDACDPFVNNGKETTPKVSGGSTSDDGSGNTVYTKTGPHGTTEVTTFKDSGTTKHKVTLTDGTTTQCNSQIPGATVTLGENGDADSSLDYNGSTINVHAGADGNATHSVTRTINGAAVTTRAHVNFAGATTTIGANGTVETNATKNGVHYSITTRQDGSTSYSMEVNGKRTEVDAPAGSSVTVNSDGSMTAVSPMGSQNGYNVETVVTHGTDGSTRTGFRVTAPDGTVTTVYTLGNAQQLSPGTSVRVVKHMDGSYEITVRTQLDGDLVF